MTVDRARILRSSMTDAEMRLWVHLRQLRRQGLAFRRQSPVGRYILDFECRPARLAVEVDGGQHAHPEQRAHDAQRTRWLEAHDYQVLRYWNADVLRDATPILEDIISTAASRLRIRFPS